MLSKNILLACYFNLEFSTRIQQAVKELNREGFSVDLLTSDKNNEASELFGRVHTVNTWEFSRYEENSNDKNRVVRIAKIFLEKF